MHKKMYLLRCPTLDGHILCLHRFCLLKKEDGLKTGALFKYTDQVPRWVTDLFFQGHLTLLTVRMLRNNSNEPRVFINVILPPRCELVYLCKEFLPRVTFNQH
jgi:hypothetical protein